MPLFGGAFSLYRPQEDQSEDLARYCSELLLSLLLFLLRRVPLYWLCLFAPLAKFPQLLVHRQVILVSIPS